MSGEGCSETSGGWVDATVRTADGRDCGRCRVGYENMRADGRARLEGGRKGGIGPK